MTPRSVIPDATSLYRIHFTAEVSSSFLLSSLELSDAHVKPHGRGLLFGLSLSSLELSDAPVPLPHPLHRRGLPYALNRELYALVPEPYTFFLFISLKPRVERYTKHPWQSSDGSSLEACCEA